MPGRSTQGTTRPTRLCRDVIGLLTEYVEGGLTEAEARGLQAHLQDCPPCVSFLASLKTTRAAVGRLQMSDIPADCRRELRDFLRKQTRPRGPSRPSPGGRGRPRGRR